MNTHIFKVKNKSQMEVFSTVSSLNSILKIFALSCISRIHGQFKSSHFIFQVVFLLIVLFLFNILSVYYKIFYYKDDSTFIFTLENSLQVFFLFGYIQYIVDIYFVNKHGRECYLNYMRVYEYVDKILGITSYKYITRSINTTCALLIIITFISSIATYTIWSVIYGWASQVVYIIDYIYIFLKLLSNLDYISNCTQIRYRLTTIEEKLKDFYYVVNHFSGVHENSIPFKLKEGFNDKRKQIDFFNNTNVRPLRRVILQLDSCYLYLIEQCDYINTMFGYRILLSSIHFLIDTIIHLNFLTGIIVGKVILHHDYQYFAAIVTAMYLISSLMIIFYGLNCCEQSYREVERILNLINHIKINKTIDLEVRDSLEELRHLIVTRPIIFHAANFFKLEYPTLVSVISVIVTYTILLVQYVKY